MKLKIIELLVLLAIPVIIGVYALIRVKREAKKNQDKSDDKQKLEQ